jgi:hypothetical protein
LIELPVLAIDKRRHRIAGMMVLIPHP